MNIPAAGPSPDEPAAGPLRRLRRWLGLASDPPLPRPPVRRLRPVRRSWALATWQARAAVLSRTTLDDYLRSRLAHYLLRARVPRSELPLHVEVAGGDVIATRPMKPPAQTAPEGPDAWAAALVALEGPSALREAAELRARLGALDAEAAAARQRAAEVARRFDDDVAAGKFPALPRPEDAAEQLGRPAVRGVETQAGLATLAVAAVVADAWAIAVPALSAAGRYPIVLEGDVRPDLVDVALTCTFALGISVGLLGLALVALRSAEAFAEAIATARRRRAQGTALVAAVACAWAAAAAATMPAPRSGLPPPSHAVLLLAVSAGAALLLGWAGRERAARAAERAAALAWDRERARALGDRARRQDELAWAEAAVRECDGRRERARSRLDELARRSTAAARILARADRIQRDDRNRLAQSLVGALERDRYEFLRQATARGATDLVAAPWKPDEPRPPVPADAPPPEPGRMAG